MDLARLLTSHPEGRDAGRTATCILIGTPVQNSLGKIAPRRHGSGSTQDFPPRRRVSQPRETLAAAAPGRQAGRQNAIRRGPRSTVRPCGNRVLDAGCAGVRVATPSFVAGRRCLASRTEDPSPEPARSLERGGPTPRSGRTLRALLVEDNRGDINLIQHALKDVAVKVDLHVEEDGVKALDFLRRTGKDADGRLPDFILLDLKLPRKTGLEVLSEIKREPELRQIPVVVLTSSNAVTDVMRAYELQAAAYFVKPVTGLEDVVGAIIGFMSSAKLPEPIHPSRLSEALL